MDIFGIGPLELFFILLIALIIFGPKDMVKAGSTMGLFLRKIVTSTNWRLLQQASREIRYLPNRLIREAGLKEVGKEIEDITRLQKEIGIEQIQKEFHQIDHDLSDWITPRPAPEPSDWSDKPTPPTGSPKQEDRPPAS